MKHYVRCRWAIDEQILGRLERLTRHTGTSVQRLVNDALLDFFDRYADGEYCAHKRTPRHRRA
jgi:hypothetical protein